MIQVTGVLIVKATSKHVWTKTTTWICQCTRERLEVKQRSCGTLQLTYGLEQSDQIYTLICNTEGDTVKLSKDTGFIAVYEVILISTGKRYHSMLILLVALTTTSNYSYSSIFPISRTADI